MIPSSAASQRIVPHRDLAKILLGVEHPGRYVGGEFGSIVNPDPGVFRVAVSFPDLYEIGMSNTAIKLLYGMLNTVPGVSAERVFVPAPDFESALADAGIPLYTLETGTPLGCVDMIAVSYGYELLATNLLTLLSAAGIPRRRAERDESQPLVIVGGPGATNPKPIAAFVDGVYLGEAEAGWPQLVRDLADMKRQGAGREELLSRLDADPSTWVPGGTAVSRRAIWNDFGSGRPPAGVTPVTGVPSSFGAGFPVPNLPIVQDYGVVEIMRGCPQGCRFCHAGMYYRPYRMKPRTEVMREIEWLVAHLGYREISLSSLSTGDYGELDSLLKMIHRRFEAHGVSVQVPSLRVNSVTLPIMEQLSRGRRSGLTFAVESADHAFQATVNKLVPLERTIAIAQEAKRRGWKHAKLYFMIGLPVAEPDCEAPAIVEYVTKLRRATGMDFVLNVGTFVPKPHTPFQWEAQLDPLTAMERIANIRDNLPRGVSLRYHPPELSWLESVLTRGDECLSEAILMAHHGGARLDAWTEHANIDLWKNAVSATPGADRGLGPFKLDETLPWDSVDLTVRRSTLKLERAKARQGITTERCAPECRHHCGVCNGPTRVRELNVKDVKDEMLDVVGEGGGRPATGNPSDRVDYYMILRYRKTGPARFVPHLAMVRSFERIWTRLNVPVSLSEGYHPKPKMSFGQPLPLGVASNDELLVVKVQKSIRIDNVSQRFNDLSPDGLVFCGACVLRHMAREPRIPAPMQRFGASQFEAVGPVEEIGKLELELNRLGAQILVHSAAHEGRRSLEFQLSSELPGLGRIVKGLDMRGELDIRRLAMLDRDGGPLFEYFRSHVACIAAVPE